MSRGYTEEQDETIRAMDRAGERPYKIARAIGKTPGSLYWRMLKLGLREAPLHITGPRPAPVIVATRKCLKCRKPFQAEKNMFVCDECKCSSAWRAGSGFEVRI